MPNHVKNILNIHAGKDRASEILRELQNDEAGIGSIDFNKLIPMPKELNIESGSVTDKSIQLYLTSINPLITYYGDNKANLDEYTDIIKRINEQNNPYVTFTGMMPLQEIKTTIEQLDSSEKVGKLLELGKRAVDNALEFGSKDWYDWSIKNWGTKWNAYECELVDDNTITFLTAWAAPNPIIQAISEKYPEIAFSHSWADEDIGAKVGKITYIKGKVIEQEIPENQSKSAYEMASEIHDVALEDYGLHLNEDGTNYDYIEDEDDLEL